MEGTDQMLFFSPNFELCASKAVIRQVAFAYISTWQLAGGLTFSLFTEMCVWSGSGEPTCLVLKILFSPGCLYVLKHYSNLNSDNNVCQYLPQVDCVLSAGRRILNSSTVRHTEAPCCPEAPAS